MDKRRRGSRLAAAKASMYRDLVFTSAERIFAQRGFDGATMQAVAAEAGISLKTLYATFPGKEEIYREIRKQRAKEFLEHAARSVRHDGTVMQRLARGMRAYVDFLLGHREYFRIQLREGRGWGLDPADDSRSEWHSGLQLQASLMRE
ncbi:MAG TPA: helix-turn-helix domain-containing protein, partial [Candidatus Binatia bacterium]|nr:helix-turn-helix domain-containing protein [Candidatus Binatia bacterium]